MGNCMSFLHFHCTICSHYSLHSSCSIGCLHIVYDCAKWMFSLSDIHITCGKEEGKINGKSHSRVYMKR